MLGGSDYPGKGCCSSGSRKAGKPAAHRPDKIEVPDHDLRFKV